MFLCTRVEDRFRLVWEGDPCVKAKIPKGQEPAWIAAESAKLKAGGEKPDVIVARPLTSDEVIRVVSLSESDPAFMIFAATLGVVAIERGSGETIENREEIQAILHHAANIESVSALCTAIYKASSEGLAALPFRIQSPS